MSDYLFAMADRQKESLRLVAGQVQLPMAEVLRRFLDHCLQGQVLNMVFPAMSGSVAINGRGK